MLRRLGNAGDERALDAVKLCIDDVVVRNDLLCQHYITFYIGINAFRDHFNDCLRHFAQNVEVARVRPGQKRDDLGDVLRLIADALQIGDHFERGGDLPQVARHGLLL